MTATRKAALLAAGLSLMLLAPQDLRAQAINDPPRRSPRTPSGGRMP